jgi:patatin-like phospholipase/acyl hydrolase
MSEGYRRILSLDGGGTWALVQARTLVDLFPDAATGHDVLRRFDLVVANSGGSVVTGGLAANLPLDQIIRLFESQSARQEVFQALFPEWLRHALPLPRYSTQGAREGLAKHLGEEGDRRLVDWERERGNGVGAPLAHLLFVGFDYDLLRAVFFRTDTKSCAASQPLSLPAGATLLDAVHASANAPVVYFDAPTQVSDPGRRARRYWDGGVAGYNNPCLAGMVEALANGSRREDIRVLSIGTGTIRRPLRPENAAPHDSRYAGGDEPSLVGDLRKLAGAIVDDPPDAASFITHVALGGRLPDSPADTVRDGPLVRMNPVLRPELDSNGEWQWNVPKEFTQEQWERLLALDMDAVADDDVALIRAMCEAWHRGSVPNQPIRAGAGMRAEVGHDAYREAKEAIHRWAW